MRDGVSTCSLWIDKSMRAPLPQTHTNRLLTIHVWWERAQSVKEVVAKKLYERRDPFGSLLTVDCITDHIQWISVKVLTMFGSHFSIRSNPSRGSGAHSPQLVNYLNSYFQCKEKSSSSPHKLLKIDPAALGSSFCPLFFFFCRHVTLYFFLSVDFYF